MTEMTDFIERTLSKDEQQESRGSGPQGSAAWLMDRCGCVTASRFEDVVGRQKNGKYYAARENYLWELVIERLTGNPGDHWTSAATQWGIDNEPRSRMAFEAATGIILEPVGFIRHAEHKLIGASPDSFIGDDGGFESKSPYNSANHLRTWLAANMPAEHKAQVQGGMWVTGRQYWYFQTYDPRFEKPLDRYCERIARDEEYIAMLSAEVLVFEREVDARVQEILSRATK